MESLCVDVLFIKRGQPFAVWVAKFYGLAISTVIIKWLFFILRVNEVIAIKALLSQNRILAPLA